MATVSGRDPFCEENRSQAGHILPSPWGPFGSAVVAGPGAACARRWITAAPVNCVPLTLPPAALGTWSFTSSALPSGTPDILQECGWKAAGET